MFLDVPTMDYNMKSIEAGLKDSGFVCPGTCVLIEPNRGAFQGYKVITHYVECYFCTFM